MQKSFKVIAIDFDGTIVKDAYPEIGKPMMFAFETMKKLQDDGFRLILWTYRCGDKLQEAVDFCKKNGIDFYAVNSSYEDEVFDGFMSRKIDADYFIDDRNIGGFVGWGVVYSLLTKKGRLVFEDSSGQKELDTTGKKKKKKGFRLFG